MFILFELDPRMGMMLAVAVVVLSGLLGLRTLLVLRTMHDPHRARTGERRRKKPTAGIVVVLGSGAL